MKRTKRITSLLCLLLTSTLLLGGCGSGKAKSKENGLLNGLKDRITEDNPEERSDEATETIPVITESDSVDLSSEASIREFLAGEWTYLNRDTGETFGTLVIQPDGTVDFTRTHDQAKGHGSISFSHGYAKENENPDQFGLSFTEMDGLIPQEALDPADYPASFDTSGIFRIGILPDKDTLYLKEIGNGDTMISCYAFNIYGDMSDPERWSPEWLFYRQREEKAQTADTTDTFYAWAWERGRDGVYLQAYDVHSYETYEDYTDRKFLGAYFSEQPDIRSGYYKIDESTDTSDLVEMRRWSCDHPLMMYSVEAEDGKISKITEVDQSYYNIYDLGDIAPSFSYSGTVFKVDNYEIDMRDHVPLTDQIMNCTQVGNWIIVDCHVNPQFGMYEFYNTLSGDIEYEIQGSLLTWRDDDLSTAVYAVYNQIYDIWGHMIGWVDAGEVYELAWLDDETVGAKCWIVDETGREKEFTEKFEYRKRDKAVWSYLEYQLGGDRQWRELLREAPDDAVALLIVDPPEKLFEKLADPVPYETGALDKIMVVSLKDGAKLHIEPGADMSGNGENTGMIYDLNRGFVKSFEITVPEGLPNGTVVVQVPDLGEARWDIWQLSGEAPVMSTFLTTE
ncbi:MAG: hypothetical protein J5518_09905 [Lachnospiraceae bacterium]|nr:hypothetical protein [Lachnospiraceae bacterium]